MVCNDEISQFCANSWRHDYPRREVPSTRSVLIFPGWPLFRDRYDRRRYSHESSYLWCSRLARETPAVTFETATRKRLLRYCHVIEWRYHKPCRMSNFIASRLPLFWMRCPTYFAFLSIYIYIYTFIHHLLGHFHVSIRRKERENSFDKPLLKAF